jgi:hypothetical protein
MSTVYGTTRDTAIDALTVVRTVAQSTSALVGGLGLGIDALTSKMQDLHANVTHEAEEKRISMVEFSMAEFDKNHAIRMVKAEAELDANPAAKSRYMRIQSERAARKAAAAEAAPVTE